MWPKKLHKALEAANLEKIQRILGQYPSLLDPRLSLKETLLLLACKLGHSNIVEWLIHQGAI